MDERQIMTAIKEWEQKSAAAAKMLEHLRGLLETQRQFNGPLAPSKAAAGASSKKTKTKRRKKSRTRKSSRITAKSQVLEFLGRASEPLSIRMITQQGEAAGKSYSRQSYSNALIRLEEAGEVFSVDAPETATAQKLFWLESRRRELEGPKNDEKPEAVRETEAESSAA